MTCQHPRCTRPIHSICSNHCFWSLCSHHLDEHRTILINEFEQVVQDLIKPTNVLSKSVEQTKENTAKDQQHEFDLLERSHQNQIQKFDQRLIAISRLQIQHNQMSENLAKIKNNESNLTQDDFHKVDKLIQEIHQQKTLPTGSFTSKLMNYSNECFRFRYFSTRKTSSIKRLSIKEFKCIRFTCLAQYPIMCKSKEKP